MNAAAVDNVGILKLKIYLIRLIDMWHHPKYYKELRKRNKSDQAISDEASTEATSVRPGPGLQHQASTKLVNACIDQEEPQAPSNKLQAASSKQQA